MIVAWQIKFGVIPGDRWRK